MSVWTAMACQTGEHEAQAVEKLCAGAECTPDAGHGRPLMECKCCRDVKNVVNLSLGCLRHAAPSVSRERFKVAPRSLCIQNAKGKRRLS